MIGMSVAVLTVGSLIGMLLLEGNVQKSFAALHTFMTIFTMLLIVSQVDFDT